MPQIIVTAGAEREFDQATVMLRERVNPTDFESKRFLANLLERLGWAIEDATAAEEAKHCAEGEISRLPEAPQPESEPVYAWGPELVGAS